MQALRHSLAQAPALDVQKDEQIRETYKLVVDSVKGNVFINQYLIIKDLGKGATGSVKLCLNTSNNALYAMKVLSKEQLRKRPAKQRRASMFLDSSPYAFAGHDVPQGSGHSISVPQAGSKARRMSLSFEPQASGGSVSSLLDAMDVLHMEIAVMKKLQHPNVVKLHEVIDDPEHNKLLMLMEYVDGGCVMTGGNAMKKEPIPESVALDYFRDILTGLEYLHFNRIVHGDIKPDNLLLSSSLEVKISDFGSACFCSHGEMMSHTDGTPAFLAPEVCSGQPYSGFPADIWALGVSLYMFVNGTVPFKGGSRFELYDNIQTKDVVFQETAQLSDRLKDLILGMLNKDPRKRLELSAIKNHSWVTQGGILRPLLTCSMSQRVRRPSAPERKAALTPGSNLKQLVPTVEERQYVEGQCLLREGTIPEGLFFIEEGTVEILTKTNKVEVDEEFADSVVDSDESDNECDGEPLRLVVATGAPALYQGSLSFSSSHSISRSPTCCSRQMSMTTSMTNSMTACRVSLTQQRPSSLKNMSSGASSTKPQDHAMISTTRLSCTLSSLDQTHSNLSSSIYITPQPSLPELHISLAELQTSARELQTSSLELRTSALELQTSARELQTSARELQTSARELQTSLPERQTSDFSEMFDVDDAESEVEEVELNVSVLKQSMVGSAIQQSLTALRKGMTRSTSMHSRIRTLVAKASEQVCVQRPSMNLPATAVLAYRGAGSIVGCMKVGAGALPSQETVIARSPMVKVLLFKHDQLKNAVAQYPEIRAAIAKAQSQALVQASMERFAEYEPEMMQIDNMRKSLTLDNSNGSIMTKDSSRCRSLDLSNANSGARNMRGASGTASARTSSSSLASLDALKPLPMASTQVSVGWKHNSSFSINNSSNNDMILLPGAKRQRPASKQGSFSNTPSKLSGKALKLGGGDSGGRPLRTSGLQNAVWTEDIDTP